MKNDPTALPRSLEFTGGLVLILAEAAEQAARRGMRAVRHRYRKRIGATLRPGGNTPLWNELVKQAQPYLRRRGSKAQLARLLNLPRQRVHDCLKAESACLDAERALLLMCWVAACQQKQPFLR
ncbi:MAG: hypothetical protein PSW75_09940 [bacterium]|nr:hypothetical protein [bacterium]MDI1336912.1 hypothetical protein [Lacunisphaera sp.]